VLQPQFPKMRLGSLGVATLRSFNLAYLSRFPSS
jgi:hypothetical protein